MDQHHHVHPNPQCLLEPGDILFLPAYDLIGRFLSLLLKSDIVHTAMMVDSNHFIEAEMGVPVRIRPLTYQRYIAKRAALSLSQREALVQYALTFIEGQFHYNYCGIFQWFLRLRFHNPSIPPCRNLKRVYCSELVDQIYHSVGIELVPGRLPGDVLPTDLYNSRLLTEVCKVGIKPPDEQ